MGYLMKQPKIVTKITSTKSKFTFVCFIYNRILVFYGEICLCFIVDGLLNVVIV